MNMNTLIIDLIILLLSYMIGQILVGSKKIAHVILIKCRLKNILGLKNIKGLPDKDSGAVHFYQEGEKEINPWGKYATVINTFTIIITAIMFILKYVILK